MKISLSQLCFVSLLALSATCQIDTTNSTIYTAENATQVEPSSYGKCSSVRVHSFIITIIIKKNKTFQQMPQVIELMATFKKFNQDYKFHYLPTAKQVSMATLFKTYW